MGDKFVRSPKMSRLTQQSGPSASASVSAIRPQPQPSAPEDTPESLPSLNHDYRFYLNAALTYIVFALFGITSLIAWNTWITADSFFKKRLEGSMFESNFQSWFASVYMLTNLMSLTTLVVFHSQLQVRPLSFCGTGWTYSDAFVSAPP
jgi:hypothetical protein